MYNVLVKSESRKPEKKIIEDPDEFSIEQFLPRKKKKIKSVSKLVKEKLRAQPN